MLNNAQRARYLARVVSHLMARHGEHEVRIPLGELENVHALGLVVENGELILALGDKPSFLPFTKK